MKNLFIIPFFLALLASTMWAAQPQVLRTPLTTNTTTFTSPSAGQVVKIHSTSPLVLTNGTAGAAAAGGSDTQLQYNNAGSLAGANFFIPASANATNANLTGILRSYRLIATNGIDTLGWLHVTGMQTNDAGLFVTGQLSATNIANLKLTALTTNVTDFASPSAGQIAKIHSVSSGNIVWTNVADASGAVGGSTTEIQYNNGGSPDGAAGFVIVAGSETNANLTGVLRLYRLVSTNGIDSLGWLHATGQATNSAGTWTTTLDASGDSTLVNITTTGNITQTGPVANVLSGSTIINSTVNASGLISGDSFLATNSIFNKGWEYTLGKSTNGNTLEQTNGINVWASSGFPALTLKSTTSGSFELANTVATTQTNSLSPNFTAPAAGQLIAFHAVSAAGGTNAIAATNITATSGWGVQLSVGSGQLVAHQTNALTLMATNATTFQTDFTGGTPLVQTADFMRTNVTLQLTNPIVGRVITFHFRGDGNAVDRTVTLSTNGLTGNWPISWGWNSPTNGATAFTVTNNIGAECSILTLSNRFSAFWQPMR